VFDLDTDMTAFSHPDRSLTRRIVAAASDATAVNGWLVRQLPLLFQRAGVIDVRARGFFPLETHVPSFYASMADRSAEAAVKAGVVTESEGRAWLDAFRDQGAQGPIVAGRLHIFVWGRYTRSGVEFVRPPKQEPYGIVAVFKDLYGNMWDLLQPKQWP
jgi:hypothetical protein